LAPTQGFQDFADRKVVTTYQLAPVAGGALSVDHPMPRILIIDDDPDLRHLLRYALVRHHHEVIEAANGRDGVRRWRESHPDLVITDMKMPEKDGLDTLFEMVSLDPGVRVIAMTGGDWKETVDRLHDARLFGAVRTVAKPFTLSEMLRVVGEVLAG
jgi:DNA-binding NtrC family response regulator